RVPVHCRRRKAAGQLADIRYRRKPEHPVGSSNSFVGRQAFRYTFGSLSEIAMPARKRKQKNGKKQQGPKKVPVPVPSPPHPASVQKPKQPAFLNKAIDGILNLPVTHRAGAFAGVLLAAVAVSYLAVIVSKAGTDFLVGIPLVAFIAFMIAVLGLMSRLQPG